MKQLEVLSLTRLTVLEYGQHIKSVHKNILLLGVGFVTDAVMTAYLAQLDAKSIEYDKAMKNIAKSDETAKILTADIERDNGITTLERQLSVYEHSSDASKHLAYLSVRSLFKVYKGIKVANYEEESNGIDNLIVDLRTAKYSPHATLMMMTNGIDELEVLNTKFKDLFDGRTQEIASKEIYDVRAMRADMGIVYSDFCNYTLSMSKAMNTPQYNQSLQVINTIRKYYSDRLVSRPMPKKGQTTEPIPPMEE
ncbi:DUF6261 family protein [Flavobacterium sp.]